MKMKSRYSVANLKNTIFTFKVMLFNWGVLSLFCPSTSLKE